LNNIKTDFTIKDLENLSGIKAHTIRIWEKRYQLLKPQRTSGNIRYYDTISLQKLLNVALLNKNKYKISKIAEMSDDSIVLLARELANKNALVDDAINSLKISMFSFDQVLFNQTYNQLLIHKTFRQVFFNPLNILIFLPYSITLLLFHLTSNNFFYFLQACGNVFTITTTYWFGKRNA
jgi:DNA-binding transcriptional MerR regulator